MRGSLHERLQRLRRSSEAAPAAGPPATGLDRLERALLGEAGGGLSLKERLERLVAAASRGRPRDGLLPECAAPVPIEEIVFPKGRRVENGRGEFFLVEHDAHLETLHGEVPLSRLQAPSPGSVAILAGEPQLEGFDLRRAVFLDTETTGLAGGTGTAAFLVGIGFVDDDRFRVRQYFMRDYHEEAALLDGLAEDLRPFRHLVTFNGVLFDVPLLEARYRINRARFPLAEALHLDLLPPARRLWKERLLSCRLETLEAELLGVRRRGDVSGEEIPRIYFDYVRSRDGRGLARVLEHNRLDLVSLAALAALACQWVEEPWAEDPRDVYSLARVFERASLLDRAEREHRRVLESAEGPLRVPSLLWLAARAREGGDFEGAVRLWEEAAGAGDWLAFRQLAVHHEHRSRDLSAALAVVERGLERLPGLDGPGLTRAASDFRRRRERLLRKLARNADPSRREG